MNDIDSYFKALDDERNKAIVSILSGDMPMVIKAAYDATQYTGKEPEFPPPYDAAMKIAKALQEKGVTAEQYKKQVESNGNQTP